jgi:SAM-dependent methyltransferase
MSQALKLLPPESLLKTGEVDHADWNHRPIIGVIQRLRYRLALALLGNSTFGRLLEVGYGSGVFMPELAARCNELYGIDIHSKGSEVEEVLRRHGVRAQLSTASVTKLPFKDKYFDCVVTVSSLEFVDDIESACHEVGRVLAPGGVFVVITPGHSLLVDWGLKILTGEDAGKDFGQRREAIVPALRREFVVEQVKLRPQLIHRLIHLYSGLSLGRPEERGRRTHQ